MSETALLTDAIKAIRDKIVTSSATATPEELAYLGTAVEKMAGRASILEIVDVAENSKDSLVTGATAAVNTAKDAAISSITTTATTVKDQAIQQITTAKNDATSAVDGAVMTINTAITNAQSVAATLVAQQGAGFSRVRLHFLASM